jgi:hypothetical protein
MLKCEHTAAMRTTGYFSFRPQAAPIVHPSIVQLCAAKRFNAVAVTRNCEMPLERMYQRCAAGLPAAILTLPPDILDAEHRALAPCVASNAELCS